MSGREAEPQQVDHYADRYWNDLPAVLGYMCRSATGDSDVWWTTYVKRRYATPPRGRALVIACGTGWVERELFDLGVASHFDAFDPNPGYLEQAEAHKGERSIDYFEATFTNFKIEHEYDLVINVAALHHARRLYSSMERMSRALAAGGLMINFDYVGPSRNQYSRAQLALMEKANSELPERLRTPHPLRPDLRTIVPGDPTEAVHAAEIERALRHYFDVIEWRDLGGGIAYQILWNNIEGFLEGGTEAEEALARLIRLDEEQTRSGRVPTLFAFFVARPRRSGARLGAAWDRYLREPVREGLSRLFLRNYYPRELPGLVRRWVGRQAGSG